MVDILISTLDKFIQKYREMRFYVVDNLLTWIGKYTYGSQYCRGTFINIFSQYGDIDFCNQFNEEPKDDHVFIDVYSLRQDNSIKIKGFDLEQFFKREFIPFSEYDESFNGISLYEYLEKQYEEDGDLIAGNLENTYIDGNGKTLYLKVNKELIFEEMREIENFAKMNNINTNVI